MPAHHANTDTLELPASDASLAAASDNPYRSFWMGGFEGADHLNSNGLPLDMATGSGHVAQLEADHARAAALGIRTVRETIGWRLAETGPGRFDLARARRIAVSADRQGLQVLWTLMHYGTPADVDLRDDSAIDRFAAFAAAVALTLGPLCERPPIYNLVNEISFLAWAVSHTRMIHPYRAEPGDDGIDGTSAAGYEVKRRLVRMVLAGVAAVRAIDPRARFLHVEPLVHVVAPQGRPELADLAEQIGNYQWQAWDMIGGRAEAELGGDPAALDLIGINHYHSSQWEATTEERLWWHLRDDRRRPFSQLLETAWQRYRRPMMIAETSHFGEGRAQWLNELAAEVARARAAEVPVHGICLYPLVDRPDWDEPARWHHSGLWDVATDGADAGPPQQRRVLCPDYAAALRCWQDLLPEPVVPPARKPLLVAFSHLRWGFVQHRPQQMMTRLAARFQIVFVEEPLPLTLAGAPARLDCVSHGPDIDVLMPRTPLADPGFGDAQLAVIGPLLAEFLARRESTGCTAWFYTPMAEPLRAWLPPGAVVVCDCIDEMSAFLDSPPQLPAREAALLAAADLVLASGPSLQRAKQPLAPAEVHLVANGVAAADFAASAVDAGSAQASEARRLQGPPTGPRLGYSGVIDERIDLALIEALAGTHPEWQIVMAGPVVKIDPARLPQLPNLLWLGHQPYVRLPHLIATWDVCLIPFADNRVTRFANPTKTLEYLAAGKPVVATRVPDLVELYPEAVASIAGTPAFIAACELALRQAPMQRATRGERSRRLVAEASWDARVAQVFGLLERVGALPADGGVDG